MIKNIIFDLGNVLLLYDPVSYLKNIFNDSKIEDLLMKEIFQSEEWVKLDEGTIDHQDAIELISSKNPQYRAHIKYCMNDWVEMLIPIKETVEILYELKDRKYRLYVLSNFHSLAFKEVLYKYDFLKCFDGGIISSKVHLLKPNIDIFNKLINTYDLDPKESVFIDDTLANVQAAKMLNIHSLHVTNRENLRSNLFKLLEEVV